MTTGRLPYPHRDTALRDRRPITETRGTGGQGELNAARQDALGFVADRTIATTHVEDPLELSRTRVRFPASPPSASSARNKRCHGPPRPWPRTGRGDTLPPYTAAPETTGRSVHERLVGTIESVATRRWKAHAHAPRGDLAASADGNPSGRNVGSGPMLPSPEGRLPSKNGVMALPARRREGLEGLQ